MDIGTLRKRLDQAEKDAHYAYNQEQRDRSLEEVATIKLAIRALELDGLVDEDEDEGDLDFSHRTFRLEFTAKRCPSNEVTGDAWLDPADLASFLRKRFTVEPTADYGLDAYNKDSGQLLLNVIVVDD